MRLEIDGKGVRMEIVWTSVQSICKVLMPVVAAVLGLLAAPEVARLVAILGG
jgi:hypothetical protein